MISMGVVNWRKNTIHFLSDFDLCDRKSQIRTIFGTKY